MMLVSAPKMYNDKLVGLWQYDVRLPKHATMVYQYIATYQYIAVLHPAMLYDIIPYQYTPRL
jgi:hypothetical protein